MKLRYRSTGVQENWRETTATVLSSEYKYSRFWDPDAMPDGDNSYFLTTFSYEVNGKHYASDLESYNEHQQGETFSILYDPADPQKNSKTRSRKTLFGWIVVLVMGAILLAFVFWIKSVVEK